MAKTFPKLLILTLVFSFVIFGLFLGAFYLTEINCLEISQSFIKSDADNILKAIESDLKKDHRILEELGHAIQNMDRIDYDKLENMITRYNSIITADHIHVIFPDNRIIPAEENILPKEERLSFASFGDSKKHILEMGKSSCREGENVIRHFVPVEKNGKVIAVLYCVTFCSSISDYFTLKEFENSFVISLVERKSGNFLYNSSKFNVSNLNELPITRGKNGIAQQKIIDDIRDGKTGYGQYMDYQYREKISVLYRPFEVIDWMVVMSVNQKSFMNEFYAKQSLIGTLLLIGFFAFLVYVLLIFADSQKMEKKLENQEDLFRQIKMMEKDSKSKSAFLYNMSHDIRTPLNAIIGFARIAKNNLSDQKKVGETLNRISTASDILSDILNNVLDMSLIESGNFYLDEAPLNIHKMLEDVTLLIQNQAADKGIQFSYEIKSILDDNLYVDGIKLKQLLVNLISNSINLSREGGNVSLKMEQITASSEEHAYYKFTVTDNGIGIRSELVEKLLDGESSEISKEDERELGVNLLTTKRIVDVMNGTMSIVSKIGFGSIISFQMPIKILPESQLYNVFMSEEDALHISGRRVLVVEDNEMNREIARYILEENKIAVEEASSGDVAVSMVNEHEEGYYDAILLDLHMPYLDGYGTAREIRSLDNTEKACIPIVAMTSSAFTDEKKRAGKAGMNGFVKKPLKVREVLTALQNVIVE